MLFTKSGPERRQVDEITVGHERPSGDLGREQPPRLAKAGCGKLGARSVQHLPHESPARVFVPGCDVDDESSGRGVDRRSIASSA